MRLRKGRRLISFEYSFRRLPMPVFVAAGLLPFFCLLGSAAESKFDKLSLSTSKKSRQSNSSPEAKEPKQVFKTVSAAIAKYGDSAREVWKARLHSLDKNMSYPPSSLVWVCLKEEKQLLIFAKDSHGRYRCLKNYPIIGASGTAGPKLKEGDKQVPEGFYLIDGFRPNVIAHLGLSVNYPNQEDRAHAKAEGRKNLGGDILIHGSKWSTGCLAMGNEPIEELFVLTYDTGYKNIELVFAPCNLLSKAPSRELPNSDKADSKTALKEHPKWVEPLYERLRNRLKDYADDLPH